MIPYEELVAALDRYVARKSGAPIPASAPAATRAAAAPAYAPSAPAHAPSYDEAHDPDLPPLDHHDDADSTHVGSLPAGARPHSVDDHEIDIGDVLSDEEL